MATNEAELFICERYRPMVGYSTGYLLPTDRHSITTTITSTSVITIISSTVALVLLLALLLLALVVVPLSLVLTPLVLIPLVRNQGTPSARGAAARPGGLSPRRRRPCSRPAGPEIIIETDMINEHMSDNINSSSNNNSNSTSNNDNNNDSNSY